VRPSGGRGLRLGVPALKDFVVAADKEYVCVVACNTGSSVVTIEVKDGFGIEVIVHIGHSEFDGS